MTRMRFETTFDGAQKIIVRSLELLAEIEDTDEAMLTDEIRQDASHLRAVVDEWLEITEVET